MKIYLILLLTFMSTTLTSMYGQFSTGNSGFAGNSFIIDTNQTTVTMTLSFASDKWFGIGFGGTSMITVQDMFIWNDTPNRDYTTNTVGNFGHNIPVADAVQSWTIVSDNVVSGLRTIVATRALVSAGNYTFLNNNTFLQLIFAQGATTTLAYHDQNPHDDIAISRFFLALENPSQTDVSIYPNPSVDKFVIKTKTSLNKIVVYNQTGDVVKTFALDDQKTENEVNIAGLATGVYIFEFHNGKDKFWKNVVVK